MSKRGANQSADTKFATFLVCDALRLIESGRVGLAVEYLRNALSILPDVGDEDQGIACVESKKQSRGIAA